MSIPSRDVVGRTGPDRLLAPANLRLVCGVGLGMSFSVGLLLLYSVGVLLPAVAADTGWSRVGVAAAAAPALMIVGLAGPVVGLLVDRFGPRRVLIVAVASQFVGMAALAWGSTSLGLFAVFYALASLLGAGHAHIPYSSAIATSFSDRRGTALGLAFGLGGIGVAIIPALSEMYLAALGWRWAYMLLGATALLISLPVALLSIPRGRPAAAGRVLTASEQGATRSNLRSPFFWALTFAFALTAFAASGGAVMLPAILADRGVPSGQVGSIMLMVGASLAVGRVASGVLLDRMDGLGLTILVFTFPALGHLLLWAGFGPWSAVLAAICFGVALGAEGDIMVYLVAQRFGLASFGRLYGICYLGYAMGSGFGPAVLSALQSVGLGPTSFLVLAAASVVSASVLAAVRGLGLARVRAAPAA